MRRPLSLAAVLVCEACLAQSFPSLAQAPPDETPSQVQLPSTQPGATRETAQSQPQPDAACRTFTAPVTVGGGKRQQAVGKTCQQPDGSLRITLEAPGLPTQVYTMPPPQEAQLPPSQPSQSQPPQQQPLPQAPPPSQGTYVYPYAYPYAYFYPPPPPVIWSNPWAFGGFPFFAGGSVFFVHDHFFFRNRFFFDHPFFARDRFFLNHPFFFRDRVFFANRFDRFHGGFFHGGFDGRFHGGGFHGGGFSMGGGFHGGGGSHR